MTPSAVQSLATGGLEGIVPQLWSAPHFSGCFGLCNDAGSIARLMTCVLSSSHEARGYNHIVIAYAVNCTNDGVWSGQR